MVQMKTIISLDYDYLMADIIGRNHGIDKRDIDALEKNAVIAATRIRQERERGELVFLDIAALQRHITAIKSVAESLKGRFKKLVVLGIGGSASGHGLYRRRCSIIKKKAAAK